MEGSWEKDESQDDEEGEDEGEDEDPPPHEIINDVEIKRKTKFLLNNEIFSVFPSCSFDARLRDVLLCNTFSSSITR